MRMTRQRHVIVDALKGLTSHPTADELYRIVRKKLPRISLATVYRNLELLSDQGVIHKLEYAGSMKRFDGNVEKHYHVRCVQCGRTDDVFLEPISNLNKQASNLTDFEIRDHWLEFSGLCPDCRMKNASGPGNSQHPSTNV